MGAQAARRRRRRRRHGWRRLGLPAHCRGARGCAGRRRGRGQLLRAGLRAHDFRVGEQAVQEEVLPPDVVRCCERGSRRLQVSEGAPPAPARGLVRVLCVRAGRARRLRTRRRDAEFVGCVGGRAKGMWLLVLWARVAWCGGTPPTPGKDTCHRHSLRKPKKKKKFLGKKKKKKKKKKS